MLGLDAGVALPKRPLPLFPVPEPNNGLAAAGVGFGASGVGCVGLIVSSEESISESFDADVVLAASARVLPKAPPNIDDPPDGFSFSLLLVLSGLKEDSTLNPLPPNRPVEAVELEGAPNALEPVGFVPKRLVWGVWFDGVPKILFCGSAGAPKTLG